MWTAVSRLTVAAAILIAGGQAFADVAAATTPPDTAPPDTEPVDTEPVDTSSPDDSIPDGSVPPGSVPADEDEGSITVTGGDTVNGSDQPRVTAPLVRVIEGCTAPALPEAVFVGTAIAVDYRTVRFQVDQVRSGSVANYLVPNTTNQVDIRYGLDAQYVAKGSTYLVGANFDKVLGLLQSRVTPPIEDFGGDEVIGISETDAVCPEFEDPITTLTTDGQPIEGSVLQPLAAARAGLVRAFMVPLGLIVLAVFALALLRNTGRAALAYARDEQHDGR